MAEGEIANQPQQPVPPPPVITSVPQPQVPPSNPGSSPPKENFYPKMTILNNDHPSRLLSFPLIGIIIRVILLIPAYFVLLFVSLAAAAVSLIMPFYILFKGKYWQPAHAVIVAFLIYSTKIALYLFGNTDKYPGFNFETNGIFEIEVKIPEKPSRLLAFPGLGILIRILFILPFRIFETVLANGIRPSVIFSWFGVLFTGKYPESLFEFNRDYIRVSNASVIYLAYLSDTYPSFHISMNHKPVKILLIVLGVILMIFGTLSDLASSRSNVQNTDVQTESLNTDGL